MANSVVDRVLTHHILFLHKMHRFDYFPSWSYLKHLGFWSIHVSAKWSTGNTKKNREKKLIPNRFGYAHLVKDNNNLNISSKCRNWIIWLREILVIVFILFCFVLIACKKNWLLFVHFFYFFFFFMCKMRWIPTSIESLNANKCQF